ncbi:tetratricopeptide repeat protein [Planctomycetota bacterium]
MAESKRIFGGASFSWRTIKMGEIIKSKRSLFLKAKLASVYKQLVILNPDNADAHIHLGDACYELEKYEDAIAAYKKAIKLYPNDPVGHYDLAKAYLKIGNKDRAFEEYKILKTPDGRLEKELFNLIHQ